MGSFRFLLLLQVSSYLPGGALVMDTSLLGQRLYIHLNRSVCVNAVGLQTSYMED